MKCLIPRTGNLDPDFQISLMMKVRRQIHILTTEMERHGVTSHQCRYMNSQLTWFADLVCMSFLYTALNGEIKFRQTLQKNLDVLKAS